MRDPFSSVGIQSRRREKQMELAWKKTKKEKTTLCGGAEGELKKDGGDTDG